MGNFFSKKTTAAKKDSDNESFTSRYNTKSVNCTVTHDGHTTIDKKIKKPLFISNDVNNKKSTDNILDEIVDRYMKNNLINNPAIPDWIERKIYKNVLKLAIGVASDTFNNTNFELLGHNISVSIKPKQD
jgi:hypothetical protein